MATKTFQEFQQEIATMSAQERLNRAEAFQEYLIIERQSVVSSGGDGVSITRNLDAVTKLIQMLQTKVNQEACTWFIQSRIVE